MSSTAVQIRNLPEYLHRQLKARAASEGMSLSDYIVRELGKVVGRLSRRAVLDRLRARPVRTMRQSAADVIRLSRHQR